MIGHEDIKKSFLRLVKKESLSHAYIFFGETQVGKLLFARNLAGFLEFGKFDNPERPLSETLIVKPISKESGEASIGIDQIRDLKNFLFEKPINSKYRLAIVDGANLLTDQAQNAILKIAEEPPQHAVLILILANPETLLKTVQSRFQKIYFGRVPMKLIQDLLVNEAKLKTEVAKEIAGTSFGRPGRALDLVRNEKLKGIMTEAKSFLKSKSGLKDLLGELSDIENREKIEPFLTELIAELSLDSKKNHAALRALIHRLRMLQEWNVNKRIQLESALTPIIKNMAG